MTNTPARLLGDLHNAGVSVRDLWELVNAPTQYRSAVPVLIDWLQTVDARVPANDRPSIREGLVRALTIPAARPAAAPVLISEFRRSPDPSGLGYGWVVGNALSVVGDDSVFDDMVALAQDDSYGKGRQMIVLGLARSTKPQAIPLLVSLLDDDDVVAHAVIALGKLKPTGMRSAVEVLLTYPRPLVRREAKKALARLPQ
jgi:hypothetical protein